MPKGVFVRTKIGYHLSDEHKLNISKANKGRLLSEETKKKISQTRIARGCGKGEKSPNWGKRGILSPNFGKKRPPRPFRADERVVNGIVLRRCIKCNDEKVVDNFRKRYKRNRICDTNVCKKCELAKHNEWVSTHKEQVNESQRKSGKKLKLEIMTAYGGKCNCCGESNVNFLTIDHINNDGYIHRKELEKTDGGGFYYWLRKNNFPTDNFQILCYNCNMGKYANGGVCPHKQLLT